MQDLDERAERIFVRVHGSSISHATLAICPDGGAVFEFDNVAHLYEHAPNGWRDALAELSRLGFVDVDDAKLSGLVPLDWQPTPRVAVSVVVSRS